jgi:hypothetical protein
VLIRTREFAQVSLLMNLSAPGSVLGHSMIHRLNAGQENAAPGCNAFVMFTG